VVDVATVVESRSVEETLELVAAGAGCALLSESTDQHYARTGVVIVPLAGEARCTAALAWLRADPDPTIAEIVAGVRSLDL
jgi:DNA-binding transcriptional LysR family regulator